MHSLTLLSAIAAITGLATAAPHAKNLHYHLHGRPMVLPPLSGRSIYDGKCGQGDMCGPGYCCSQWGYCGTTPDYCDTGCQPQFGTCGSNNTAPSPPSPPPPAAAPSPAQAAPSDASSDNTPSQIVSSEVFATKALAPASGGEYQKPGQAAQPAKAPAPQPATGPAPAPQYSAPPSPPTAPAPQPTYSSPAPAPASGSGSSSGGSSIVNSVYKMFTGDGAASQGWPDESAWASFDSLWSANLPLMKQSCAQFGQADNSDQENNDIKSAIDEASAASGVDKRFILAIMMQESKGCVRVWGTANGVANPGLMQSYKGKGTCYPGVNPCPASEIKQMIFDGAVAHAGSDGVTLQELLAKNGGSGADAYYKTARLYNSGPNSMPADGDLGAPGATRCYCSDIANRLRGWTDSPTQCTLH